MPDEHLNEAVGDIIARKQIREQINRETARVLNGIRVDPTHREDTRCNCWNCMEKRSRSLQIPASDPELLENLRQRRKFVVRRKGYRG